jgi:lipoprotein-anchoring transpeptidase ErfK/SrfK
MGLRRNVPLAALAAALLAPASAPAAGEERRIKPGVSSAGIDLSGLTVDEAAAKLDAQLTPRLLGDLVLTTAGRLWPLTMADAKLDLDSVRTAKRALHARARAPGAAVAVRPALRHSRAAVKAFVARVAARVRHAPRDASVRITLRRLHLRRSRLGKALAQARTRRRIGAMLDDAAAPRALRARLTTVQPRTTTSEARRAYRTVITIHRSAFKLRLFNDLRLRRTYGVAVGQPGYPTPAGLFSIQSKQVNPVWSVPNSPWAGELAGTTVQGGTAANPLKARWMGITDGVGIHGTGEDWSIGTRASHGCIRMHVPDVIALYRRVPVGTPVLIR